MVSAAFTCYYDAIDSPSPASHNVQKMIKGSIKCGTVDPMIKSKVLPRQPFMDMFMKLPDNKELDMEYLHLKTITLLALSLMLRPSDLASKAVNIKDGKTSSIQLTGDKILFLDD